MAISAAFVANTFVDNNADQSSYTSGTSVTPTSGRLIYVAIANSKGTTADTPTVTGACLTGQTQIATVAFTAGTGPHRITLIRASATGSSSTITADFGGNTQLGCFMSVIEWNVDAAVGAPTQFATNTGNGGVSVTLSSFEDATNHATFICVGTGSNISPSAVSPITNLQNGGHQSPNTGFGVGWVLGEDTTPQYTWTGSSQLGAGIACEVPDAAGGIVIPIVYHHRQRN